MTCKHSTYKDGVPICRKGYPVQLKKCMGKDDKLLKCESRVADTCQCKKRLAEEKKGAQKKPPVERRQERR